MEYRERGGNWTKKKKEEHVKVVSVDPLSSLVHQFPTQYTKHISIFFSLDILPSFLVWDHTFFCCLFGFQLLISKPKLDVVMFQTHSLLLFLVTFCLCYWKIEKFICFVFHINFVLLSDTIIVLRSRDQHCNRMQRNATTNLLPRNLLISWVIIMWICVVWSLPLNYW